MVANDYADAFIEGLSNCDLLIDHQRMSFICGIYALESTNLVDLYRILALVSTKTRHSKMPSQFAGFDPRDSTQHILYKILCEAHWVPPAHKTG